MCCLLRGISSLMFPSSWFFDVVLHGTRMLISLLLCLCVTTTGTYWGHASFGWQSAVGSSGSCSGLSWGLLATVLGCGWTCGSADRAGPSFWGSTGCTYSPCGISSSNRPVQLVLVGHWPSSEGEQKLHSLGNRMATWVPLLYFMCQKKHEVAKKTSSIDDKPTKSHGR